MPSRWGADGRCRRVRPWGRPSGAVPQDTRGDGPRVERRPRGAGASAGEGRHDMTGWRRAAMIVVGSLVAAGLLAVALAGRRGALATPPSTPAGWGPPGGAPPPH